MSKSFYRVSLGLIIAAALAMGLSPSAHADERLPIGVLPKPVSCAWLTFPGRAGAWPVPLHAPNPGIGLLTMPRANDRVQRALPPRIHLRTDKAGFNSIWQYALFGGNLYAKSAKTGRLADRASSSVFTGADDRLVRRRESSRRSGVRRPNRHLGISRRDT